MYKTEMFSVLCRGAGRYAAVFGFKHAMNHSAVSELSCITVRSFANQVRFNSYQIGIFSRGSQPPIVEKRLWGSTLNRIISTATIPVSNSSKLSLGSKLHSAFTYAAGGSLKGNSGVIVRGIKTKQAAAKRFIKTGQGKLKYGHAGKRHLTSKKSKIRKQRLNKKVNKTH